MTSTATRSLNVEDVSLFVSTQITQLALDLKAHVAKMPRLAIKLVDNPVAGLIPKIEVIDLGINAKVLHLTCELDETKGHICSTIHLLCTGLSPLGADFQANLSLSWSDVFNEMNQLSSEANSFKVERWSLIEEILSVIYSRINSWQSMTPLQREISRRKAVGGVLMSKADFVNKLSHLGYLLEEDNSYFQNIQIVQGTGEGESYPGVSMSIVEQDTGLSFANENARKDENFRTLQQLRSTEPYIVLINEHFILEI